MKAFNEKREGMRMNVSCEIHCKLKGSTEYYRAWCVTLSGSGISFFTDHEFKIGDDVKVSIEPESEVMSNMEFDIKIVRSTAQDNGLFETGASIYPKI